ncbi:MAG: hypothetical protein EBU90_27495 [Proteobacteria bacterium]|nr:hypothetical protein [Pseudomonadota bacterium]
MNITYSLGEKNEKGNAVEVIFTCTETNLSTTRLVNIPRFFDGTINDDLFQKNLNIQIFGVKKEFETMM